MYLNDWCVKVGNILSNLKFNSNEDIRVVNSMGGGYEFKLQQKQEDKGSGGGTISHLCQITSGSGAIYEVDYYDNGMDATSTGSGVVQVLQAGPSDTLPVGTWIIGTEIKSNVLV